MNINPESLVISTRWMNLQHEWKKTEKNYFIQQKKENVELQLMRVFS